MGMVLNDQMGSIFLLALVPSSLYGAFHIAGHFGWTMESNSSQTLLCFIGLALPTTLLVYSCPPFRPHRANILGAIKKGLLILPFASSMAVILALLFGAPTSLSSIAMTLYWGLLMATLAVLPAACVMGFSVKRWQRVFAFTRPEGNSETVVCILGHCTALGAWLGAMPMPLDWEKKWQEWPISCTWGAMIGYVIGCLASCVHSATAEFRTKKIE